MDWLGAITVAAAGIGAVLGVVNTVWALRRDQIRIRVRAVWMSERVEGRPEAGILTTEFAHAMEQRPSGQFGVRVTNLGFTEVTVDSVGLTSSGFWQRRFAHRLRRMPIVGDALGVASLPHRLGPRETVTLWTAATGEELRCRLRIATRVFASTACGLDVYGSSGLLRHLAKRANRAE